MNQELVNKLQNGIPLEICGVVIPWKTPFDNLTDFGEPEFVKRSEKRADLIWKNEKILNGLSVNLIIMRWYGLGGMNKKFKSAFSYVSQIEFEEMKSKLNIEFGQEGKFKKINALEQNYSWRIERCKIELNQKDRFGPYWNIAIKYK